MCIASHFIFINACSHCSFYKNIVLLVRLPYTSLVNVCRCFSYFSRTFSVSLLYQSSVVQWNFICLFALAYCALKSYPRHNSIEQYHGIFPMYFSASSFNFKFFCLSFYSILSWLLYFLAKGCYFSACWCPIFLTLFIKNAVFPFCVLCISVKNQLYQIEHWFCFTVQTEDRKE